MRLSSLIGSPIDRNHTKSKCYNKNHNLSNKVDIGDEVNIGDELDDEISSIDRLPFTN